MSAPTANEQKVVDRLERQEAVQFALEQASGEEPKAPPRGSARRRDRRWLLGWVATAGVLLALDLVLRLDVPGLGAGLRATLRHVLRGGFAIVAIFAAARATSLLFVSRLRDAGARFNLYRVVDLVAALAAGFVALSIVFQNWYTAVVSLGLISLILGFALQTPMTSLLAWIYILLRRPYRVGDRVRIGEATGDVIDVSYLDTTLWEFGGDFLSTDHPSGRVIKFPNATVLTTPVYNYSWPLFPYIWNEVRFHVAYDSDLEWVAQTMKEVAETELGEKMMSRVRIYRELLAKTHVDHLQVREHPAVLFRVSDNTWLVAILRYLVSPMESGQVKSRLIRELLLRLRREPGKVMFPKSNLR